jgi:hypothetical protein
LCVRPAHLFLGTKGDNNRDRIAKGRSAPGQRFPRVVSDDALAQVIAAFGTRPRRADRERVAAELGIGPYYLKALLEGRRQRRG